MTNPRFALLVAVLAGAITALGFAPHDLWPLTIIGTAALIALVDAARTSRRAALLGWLFGIGHFTAGLTWIATSFTYQAKMPAWLGMVTVVGLAMFLALYVALAAGITRAIAVRPLPRILVFAALWMLGEWLRGHVLTGFAWNPLGTAWLDAPGVAQLAQFGGSLGLSGLLALAAGGVWLLVRPGAALSERLPGAAIAAVIIAAGIFGARIPGAGPDTDADRSIGAPGNPTVLLVQPNIGQDQKYVAGAEDAHLQSYLDLTRAALAAVALPTATATTPTPRITTAARRGTVVIWSESAVPYAVEEEPGVRSRLAAVLGPDDVLLFGGVAVIRDRAGAVTALTNSLFVLDAGGRIRGRYDKAHLVPLGEYVPARRLMTALGVARLAPGDLDFQPGPGPQTLGIPGFPAAGVQICYEIIFPGAVVDAARRPAWIVNVSNDAWFGPSGPPQHLAQARLRAIEEGLPIARVTPTGISAIIDAYGNPSAVIAAGIRGVSSGALPPAAPPTLFARHGHLPAALFGIALLGAGLGIDRRRKPAA